ncbi:tyrosine-type recombinase/integrase [Brevundimonas sp.]|uniref:tyrosine-type recombinase/integrase n=1 Tax=Brevundimonas sp. TaxID=1871086 RepID=UPI002FCC95BC
MARQNNRLTHRFVTMTKAVGLHADGMGLYLEVDKSGGKRWTFLFQWRGSRKQMGLGGLSVVSLAEAREAADEARKAVARGVNPIEAKKAAQAEGTTFGDVADALLTSLTPGWRNPKHVYQWKRALEIQAAPLRPLPVEDVTTEDVLEVLKPLWSTTPETASRLRGRIERVLDAAKAKGLRKGENPARWKGHLALLLPKRQKLTQGHHPAMPFDHMPAFMARLRARPALSARALEFTILTVARTSEAIFARAPEFDLRNKVWTVPGDRMKMKVEHRVPLCDRAVALVEELLADQPEGSDFVFAKIDGEPLSTAAMSTLLERMGDDDFSVHGFRSTFRDWAGESTAFQDSVVEAALAHRIGNETERAYRRGDAFQKRIKLMAAWAGYCARNPSADVVPMRRLTA